MNLDKKEADLEETVELLSEPSLVLSHDPDKTALLEPEGEGEDPRFEEFRQMASIRWDDNRAVVKSYIRDLQKRKDKKAFDLLGKALKNGAPFTQKLACEALGKMGGRGIEVLVKFLVRPDGRIDQQGYDALRQLGHSGLYTLLDILQGRCDFELSLHHKVALVHLIGAYPSSKVSAVLCSFLDSMHADLRKAAQEALKKQGRYAEKALIHIFFKEKNSQRVRKVCIYLLGLMGSRKAAAQIIKLLNQETNPYLLCLQAWALGEMNAQEAVPALQFALEDEGNSWIVQRSLIRVLGKLASQQSVDSLIPLLEKRELRESVICALGRIGGDQARQALIPYVNSPIRYVRSLAISSLAQIGDLESVQTMLQGFTDADPLVKQQTEKAFEQLYSQEDLTEIHEHLEQQLEEEKRRTAWQNLTTPQPVEPLQEMNDLDLFEDEFEEESEEGPEGSPWSPSKIDPWSTYPTRKEGLRKVGLVERLRRKAESKLEELAERFAPQGGSMSSQGNYPFGGYYDPQANAFPKKKNLPSF